MEEEKNMIKPKKQYESITFSSKEFKILKILGSGAYGEIYQIEDPEGNKYALKKIKLINGNQTIRFDMLRESNFFKFCENENLVHLYEASFINKNQIALLMEYCDCDLSQFMEKFKSNPLIYNENTIKKISYQIIKGVHSLHLKLLFHRDLKPQNVLLKFLEKDNEGEIINFNNFIIKIGDLGLSRKYSMLKRKYTPGVGTLYYRAPEIILGDSYYFIGIDIWSIGCIISEMILKKPIFIGNNDKTQLIEMFKIFGTFNDENLPGLRFFPNYINAFPKYHGIGLKKFLMNNKAIDVSNDCLELICKILVVDPTKRIGLSNCLQSNWFRDVN